jgi:hypothetical protein
MEEEATMRTVIVRYRVKAAKVDEHVALVGAVFHELATQPIAGFHYAAVTADDGVSFTHISSMDTDERNPLASLASFRAFQKDIAARCDELPVATEVTIVGNCGLFPGAAS